MKNFHSILVIVPPGSVKEKLKRLVLNSMNLSKWLDSEVHFVAGMGETQAIETTIRSASSAALSAALSAASLIIHSPEHSNMSSAKSPYDCLLEMIEKYSCNLLVLMAGDVLHPTKGFGERGLLEQSPIPVFIFPKDFDFVNVAVHRFIVPLSGEQRTNDALSLSLKFAAQTDSVVDLLHVDLPGESCHADKDLGTLADQLEHEYREMPEKIASEASPYSTEEERKHIGRILHYTGCIADEIKKLLDESPGSLLAFEWNGTLATGRAITIKNILQKARCPILFVKAVPESKATLLVGKNFRAA
jgi:hypothetical protein